MTVQRRRGQSLRVWRTVTTTDRRGNEVKAAAEELAHPVRGWVIPQRSAKAEVPGQLVINVVRIGVDANLEGVDLWSSVEWSGKRWDVVAPPAYRHGTRHTRHWSIDLRERP